MNCQVKKPADRDHGGGMDGRGLGMACERSRREGGEKTGNICSLYLLRSWMHDHNHLTVPQASSASLYLYVSPLQLPHLSLCASSHNIVLLIPLSLCNMVKMALRQLLKSFRNGFRLHQDVIHYFCHMLYSIKIPLHTALNSFRLHAKFGICLFQCIIDFHF